MNIEDVDIEIVVPFGQAHHNTVMVELDTGAQFRISKKYGKDSMELEVLKDFGLSPIVGGIFGQVIRPKGSFSPFGHRSSTIFRLCIDRIYPYARRPTKIH